MAITIESGITIGPGISMGAADSGSSYTVSWGYVANLELYNIKLTVEQLQQNYYGLKGVFGL